MGFGLPAAMGAQAAFPDALVVDIDGDGSFLMNIQELATVYCEKLPVKVIVLNNQHLGMVVQWEDRFHAGNRAHTYLGPVDHPEAIGQGEGELPEVIYPDFVDDRPGLRRRGPAGPPEGRGDRRPQGDDRPPRPLRARRPGPLPGARPADDPLGRDGARHHQELMAVRAGGTSPRRHRGDWQAMPRIDCLAVRIPPPWPSTRRSLVSSTTLGAETRASATSRCIRPWRWEPSFRR